MMKKEHLKKEGNKRKKEKRDNLNDNENKELRKHKKKGKRVMHDSLMDDEKEQVRKNDKKRKMDKRLQSSIFDNFQMCSMTDPCILTVPDF